ncbi:hypothetical protein AVEN_52207-1 [Araneus ventricosus]|uniref:Uncharacterized protein n=1 Tax=Araneus ventricosus TaxID=182803 RepID=A0A4Y2RPF4_ARAVE|nr:hypothetical protein AVEN_28262-1 [Araneus ventricosus]GBN77159.1 hypothetical protein AVEN_15723-1 [Araneus ventricosus]GBN77218.1 hypothetical protein AVEN_113047-1 [Araneus ventricosus]GBN77223.1 hypothetical protein AVEN_52207-1 [Araneus ventricosus]
MDKQFEKLFAMTAEMRAQQAGLEQKMEAGQEEMRSGQAEAQNLIQAGKEEMRAHVESQVGDINISICKQLKNAKRLLWRKRSSRWVANGTNPLDSSGNHIGAEIARVPTSRYQP